jgi:hypothetical protein
MLWYAQLLLVNAYGYTFSAKLPVVVVAVVVTTLVMFVKA